MHKFRHKNILITGGAGFIGSHLAHELVQQEAQVTILDNLSTGLIDNIASIKPHIEFIQDDICNYEACLSATKNKHMVFHCAAFVSAADSVHNPEECFKSNVTGTLNLLYASHMHQVERFIFSSSAAVYGNQKRCYEEVEPRPLSPYGDSKRIGELLCQHFYTTHNLITIMLRYFNVFGKRQRADSQYAPVIARFKKCMQLNQPITIFGDGSQTRDFIPVEQIVKANIVLSQLPAHMVGNQVINVASGKSTSLQEIVSELRLAYPQYTGTINYEPTRSGDIKHSYADIKKLTRLLNFEHKKSINNEWHSIKLQQLGC